MKSLFSVISRPDTAQAEGKESRKVLDKLEPSGQNHLRFLDEVNKHTTDTANMDRLGEPDNMSKWLYVTKWERFFEERKDLERSSLRDLVSLERCTKEETLAIESTTKWCHETVRQIEQDH
jgi:hypothetical protein